MFAAPTLHQGAAPPRARRPALLRCAATRSRGRPPAERGTSPSGAQPWRPTVNDQDSDEQLMQAYAAGDADAFERLYQRFRKPLFGFLLRGLQDRGLAEECFQDVWMRVVDARRRYQPTARFSTWLFQIAHHRIIDAWRRQRPVSSLDALQEAGVSLPDLQAASPEDAAARFQRLRRLGDALASLPDEQRLAVNLRLEQSLSLEDIGEVTGVGRETVKSRLRYAMDKLRQLLGGEPA